ncbi:hypothetical protein [Thermoflexus sp.]|uniref:hypothetical protein n=1 Tax=Thermoflexus sp. TaxID=1969742 RepID=UPI002ADD8A34|nr:hypothetical protein [Thermoflexus sp.]
MNRKTFQWLDDRLRDSLRRLEWLSDIESIDAFVVGSIAHLTFLRVLWKHAKRPVLEILRGLNADTKQYVSALESVSSTLDDEFDWFILGLSHQFRKDNRLMILSSLYEYLSGVMKCLDHPVGLLRNHVYNVTVWDMVGLVCEYNDAETDLDVVEWVKLRYGSLLKPVSNSRGSAD